MFNLFSKKPAGTVIKLKITDMHCSNCALTIDDALEELEGVIESNTNYAKAETVVIIDAKKVDLVKIKATINEVGYTAE